MRMRCFALAVPLLVLAGYVAADVVVFVDGTRMSVQQYEVKGNVVVITTEDGKLRSVPRNYINLEATERLNGSQQATPVVPVASPSSSPPPAPAPPEPAAVAAPPAARPAPGAIDMPPLVWTNDELGVSLVVPSAEWQVQDMVASFDIAVQLEKREGEARATLALIRRSMRDYEDFREVIGEIETSVSATASYRFLGSGPLRLGPHTAFELRFVKEIAELPVYNRIVAYYSEDLAYVLSVACPESRLAENQDDFDALVRGLVIKKAQAELTPRGKPDS
jgi:hypothetical protein